MRVYHRPALPSDWQHIPYDELVCKICNQSPHEHWPDHAPKGDAYYCEDCSAPVHQHKRAHKRSRKDDYIVGIDGEGQNDENGNHIYTLLAYSDEHGRNKDFICNPRGLSTKQCLDFIVSLPLRARPFAYAFNYDLTMILRDVDDKTLFLLFRPELRQVDGKAKPVKWQGYTLNLMGTKFSVSARGKHIVIWDTFRFYQSKFTDALRTWKCSQKERLDNMEDMKRQRGEFDKLDPDDVRRYCLDECRDMAELTRKLIEAHVKAGLRLRSFHGAGSTASVLLKSIGIHNAKRDAPKEMDVPVASAFFGGRFENSVCGPVPGLVHGYDISSAYPYQLYRLPCLECGRWVRNATRSSLSHSTHALIRYRIRDTKGAKKQSWGPLPFRTAEGSIVFPYASGGGWVWLEEFLVAEKHWPGVEFLEAWVYKTDCDHRPFEAIPQYYVERLKIGKEGPGIVIKLGCNSCYGKLAQSVGRSRPFRSMVWAGMVTSGTRAQLLEAVALHKDRANCLMLATDGIYSREKLNLPAPIDTGTMTEHGKPLGGWEHKETPSGMFAARPGIYFPLNPTPEEEAQFRARGIGRKELYANFEKIKAAYDSESGMVRVSDVTRFHGAKSSIHIGTNEKGQPCFVRSNRYGQWRPRPIDMSFSPLPKREAIRKDGTLSLRAMPMDLTSAPYDRALTSPDAMTLKIAEAIALEQPQ